MSTRNLYKKAFIERRYRGEDVLSWIEQFGIHFLEDDKNGYKGRPNAGDHFLVLRICSAKGKKEDTIDAHHCFFKTDKEGVTTFCVNGICHFSTEKLRELFEKAKWKEDNTKNWWSEIFRNNGFQDIDDVLCRPEVVVSDSYKELSMQNFLKQIKEVIADAIKSLSLETTKITKVCIVEQYAKALPLKHVLYKMFPNSYMYTYVFTREMPMNNYGWQLKADKFFITAKLMNTKLNTSPQMTIGDILQLGEKGVVVTMPLTVTELNLPIIDDCDLRWGELLPNDTQHDFQVDDLRFKRLQLSVRADGLQNLYIIGMGESAVVTSENGNIRVLYKKSSIDKRQPIKTDFTKAFTQKTLIPKPSPTERQGVPSDEARHRIATLFFDGSDRLINVARKNIETLFKNKYQDKWETMMKKTFCVGIYKNLDFGNFPSYITNNKEVLTEYWGKEDYYFQVKNSAYALHKLRNHNHHHEIDSVISEGKAEVSRVFSDMIRVVKIMGDSETAKKIEELNLELDKIWWIK